MSGEVKAKNSTRRFAPAGLIFAALGLALFVYFVRRAGVAQVWEAISRLGAGFLIILALSGLRFGVRSLAWTMCFEPPHRLRFPDAFRAYLIGDAAGNIVPLGLVISEPAKVALVRERVPLAAGFSAIAVENMFYSLSVALFLFAGAASLLLSFTLPKALRWSSVGVLCGVGVFLAAAYLVVRLRLKVVSGLVERLTARGAGRRPSLAARLGRLRAVEERVYGFYERNRARFVPIFLLEACFHLAGVAEAYVTLYFITGAPPSPLNAFLLESVNRIINVVFKFVPMRVGVDEAGTGWLSRALNIGDTAGVALAIVRKARMLVWIGVGVAFLVGRGLSLRAIADEAGRAQESVMEEKRVASSQ